MVVYAHGCASVIKFEMGVLLGRTWFGYPFRDQNVMSFSCSSEEGVVSYDMDLCIFGGEIVNIHESRIIILTVHRASTR